MKRRELLIAGPILLIGGCALTSAQKSAIDGMPTQQVSTALQTAASNASLIATGLTMSLTALETAPGVNATTLTTLETDLGKINTAAQAIEATATTGIPPNATIVQALSAAVSGIATDVLPAIPNAAAYQPYVTAALVLIPTIETVAGITGASAPTGGMTVAQAQDKLRSAAFKH